MYVRETSKYVLVRSSPSSEVLKPFLDEGRTRGDGAADAAETAERTGGGESLWGLAVRKGKKCASADLCALVTTNGCDYAQLPACAFRVISMNGGVSARAERDEGERGAKEGTGRARSVERWIFAARMQSCSPAS